MSHIWVGFLLRVGECLLSEVEQASGARAGGNGSKYGSHGGRREFGAESQKTWGTCVCTGNHG